MTAGKNDKVKVAVLGVVFVGLMLYVLSSLLGGRRASPQGGTDAALKDQSSAAALSSLTDSLNLLTQSLAAKVAAAPRPLAEYSKKVEEEVVEEIVDIRLTGVILEDAQPLAFINGDVVGLNEKVGSWTVVGIETDRVVFTDGSGRDKVLMLYNQ